jgi:acetyl-CoA acetyltransferase
MHRLAHLSGAAAIVGYGDAYSPRVSALSPMQLAVEAAFRCVADAGVPWDLIDGVLTSREPFGDYRPHWNNVFASHLGLSPRHSTQVMIHAVGVNSMLKHALMAIEAGAADFVLCVETDGGKAFVDMAEMSTALELDREFEQPYGPWMPAMYGMICRRYMHEYSVSEEQIAATAVQHQEWARHHPQAEKFEKGAISVDDVLNSREISSPLRLLMCAPWRRAGTAGAFLVTSRERAVDLDCKPIWILGSSELVIAESYIDRMSFRGVDPVMGLQPSLTTTATMVAAKDAYAMAGLTPLDMQIVHSVSNFAHISMMMLEDLGFCEKGGAADFMADGRTGPGGSLPFNTNGGMLSFGQGGVSCVMDGIVEVVRQLRGEALGLQVDCRLGVVQAAAPSSASVTILGNEG